MPGDRIYFIKRKNAQYPTFSLLFHFEKTSAGDSFIIENVSSPRLFPSKFPSTHLSKEFKTKIVCDEIRCKAFFFIEISTFLNIVCYIWRQRSVIYTKDFSVKYK